MVGIRIQLRKTYDNISKKYSGYRRSLWPSVTKFLMSSKPSFILDIGSVTAQYANEIESFGHKILLSDYSLGQIKRAKKLGVRSPFLVFDATSMPIKSESFRLITSFAVFHHLSNHLERIKFLKEIKRVLKADGEAILTVIKIPKGGFSGNIKYGEFDRYYYFYSKKELKDLLDEVGFKEYKISSLMTDAVKDILIKNRPKKMRIGNYFIWLKK